MKTATIEKAISVRKTLTRLPREPRGSALRGQPQDRGAYGSDPQVAEIERTFSVRWEW